MPLKCIYTFYRLTLPVFLTFNSLWAPTCMSSSLLTPYKHLCLLNFPVSTYVDFPSFSQKAPSFSKGHTTYMCIHVCLSCVSVWLQLSVEVIQTALTYWGPFEVVYSCISLIIERWLDVRYRITGCLCDLEICAFWPPKKAVCGFYLCVALHGVWLSYRRYKIIVLIIIIAISVLLALSHKYHAHINNRLYRCTYSTDVTWMPPSTNISPKRVRLSHYLIVRV